MKTKTFLLAFLALLLSLSACSPAGGEESGAETPIPPMETPVELPTAAPDETTVPDEILGIWYWLAFEDSASGEESNDITVSDPWQYTLEFMADGTVQIQADCNSGTSTVTIEDNSLTFAPGPMTLAECEPRSLYDVFLARLGDVVTYVFDEDLNLVLNLKMDAGNMVFGREGRSQAGLDGTSWTLIGRGSADDLTAPLPDTEITLDFADGQVSGSAGCNSYFAGYETEESSLSLGPIGSTTMTCADETNQQEAEFLTALESVSGYEISRNMLTLTDDDGNALLIFRAQRDVQE